MPLIHDGLPGPPTNTFRCICLAPRSNNSNSTAVLGQQTNALVNILQDDSYGTFQFTQPAYLANENGGVATLTVFRTGGVLGPVSINYATGSSNHTAVAGTNYLAASGTLVFGSNELVKSLPSR